jgi:predicted dehydrogenase
MQAIIIGAGSIGERHAEVLKNLKVHVDFVSNRKDIKNIVANSIDEVINIEAYDYFLICNESAAHYETLKKLTRKVKGKKILIENPLFTERKELSIENNQCYVGYNLRFHPIVVGAMNALSSEKILSIDLCCNTYLPDWNPGRDYSKTYSAKLKLGGGVLKDVTHEIDLLHYLSKEIGKVDKFEIYKKISNLKIETNDYYRSIGSIGSVNFSLSLDYTTQIPKREIFICTENKAIKLDFILSTLRSKSCAEDNTTKYEVMRNDTYKAMHESILFDNGRNCSTYRDGQKVLEWF